MRRYNGGARNGAAPGGTGGEAQGRALPHPGSNAGKQR